MNCCDWYEVKRLLRKIIKRIERLEELVMTHKESLDALKSSVATWAGADASAFARLEAKIAAGDALTPEEEAEFNELQATIQARIDASNTEGV